MAFELRVVFTGLCMYVRHPTDPKRLAVLFPDGRQAKPLKDGSIGRQHVGYVQMNMANIDASLPYGQDEDPDYAIVHQLDDEVIDFGLDDDGQSIDFGQLFVPQMTLTPAGPGTPFIPGIARDVQLLPGLFGAQPSESLLSRTIVPNGTIVGSVEPAFWNFSKALSDPADPPYANQAFANHILWKRQVNTNDLTLRLTSFDGGRTVSLTLKPVLNGEGDSVVCLRVANLCSQNPLEWEDFENPPFLPDDVDFKWMYELVESTTGQTITTRLNGQSLPIPQVGTLTGAGVRDCSGAQIQSDFT